MTAGGRQSGWRQGHRWPWVVARGSRDFVSGYLLGENSMPVDLEVDPAAAVGLVAVVEVATEQRRHRRSQAAGEPGWLVLVTGVRVIRLGKTGKG